MDYFRIAKKHQTQVRKPHKNTKFQHLSLVFYGLERVCEEEHGEAIILLLYKRNPRSAWRYGDFVF